MSAQAAPFIPGRRDFLKLAGAGSAALVLALYLDACSAPPEITPTASPPPTVPPTAGPNAWLKPTLFFKVDNLGALTVTAFRTEMGQGIRTAIAMIIADELDMDWESVHIEQADADGRFGDQITGGSVSVSQHYMRLREAGAVARSMLVRAAADQWNADPQTCSTAHGAVIHPNGSDRLPYGELVEAASALEVPNVSSVRMKADEELHIIGTDRGHWDAPEIVRGKSIFGLDVRVPGMLFAVLARSPVPSGKLAALNDAKALQVEGVRKVVEVDGKVAVVASNTWAAIRGRQALEITWDEGAKATLNSEAMFEALEARLPVPGAAPTGTLEALYRIPYQAHETLEPVNCTADVRADHIEIWAPTQEPQLVRNMVASRTRTPTERITVHVALTGGAFGRRHPADAAVEAALISQAVGAPVQVIWTRDDDIQHDCFHPMSVQYTSMNLSNPRRPTVRRQWNEVDFNTGYWRSVDQFPEAFARESFIDEMAAALGRNPLDLRGELYTGRALGVIKLAAEKADWESPLPAGQGRGIAYHATFGVTHVAQVVEVSVDSEGRIRVQRVVCAVDCGKAINPDNVKAQMEGGIVFGLTAALMGGVTIENGRVRESNFHDAPILAMNQMPRVEVHIVESKEAPTGVGEMGVPPAAPALCNAIFAATGKRVRRLPIRAEDLRPA